MTNIDALDLAVVELAKDTERLYHDKPELFAPQVNELTVIKCLISLRILWIIVMRGELENGADKFYTGYQSIRRKFQRTHGYDRAKW